MKTLFISLNSQYIHTLLAPRYLAANSIMHDIEILESNVNIDLHVTLSQIIEKKPDIVALSCYIFNIDYIRSLLPLIKKELPNTIIIAGGYEVAFDEERYYELCHYIIKGEGDFAFGQLLSDIKNGKSREKVIQAGTVYNLDEIISPYTAEYCALGKSKILYMETCRGCPFSCSYCMSANTKSVRAFSLSRVFSDIDKMMLYAPKQIKMVDRTFNYNIKRASQIFSYIIEKYNNSNTNFHFEMAPELFDEPMFDLLKSAKKGLFQFEIGVQSYNKTTLNAINRAADLTRVDSNISSLCQLGNIRIHTDLIAGLPLEDYISVTNGFDRLYKLGVHCLQLGFLKVLKGSKIHDNIVGYEINKKPPYEIISSKHITKEEIGKLKTAEEMLELYHNSGRFVTTMSFLREIMPSPYQFFYHLGIFFANNYTSKRYTSAYDQSDCIYNFCKEYLGDRANSKEILQQLALNINKDFALSGNTRKWRRHLPL